MAFRPSPNSLIHCAVCGEDYSATYKRCPFCGAKNAPPMPSSRRAPSRPLDPEPDLDQEYDVPGGSDRRPPDPDDTYVFDGQDLFDGADGDDAPSARPKGGKRLAEGGSGSPFSGADINWPRMITFLCSLIIIIAAMVIVFTVIYPQLRGGSADPAADATEEPSLSDGETGQPVDPIPTADASGDAGGDDTEPTLAPAVPDPAALSSLSFQGANDGDFTLGSGESHTITLSFDPAGWSGDVSWTSSNTDYATVDANGKVTNVNTSDQLRSVVITISAGGHTLESVVFCKGVASEPDETEPPAADTQAPSGGGTVTVGQPGTIVGAEGGLRVRSGPGTDNSVLATLSNGSPIQVVAAAEDGWYEITFIGSGGDAVTGYILGDYISTD